MMITTTLRCITTVASTIVLIFSVLDGASAEVPDDERPQLDSNHEFYEQDGEIGSEDYETDEGDGDDEDEDEDDINDGDKSDVNSDEW
ncbi:hypothetical protein ACH42_11515 [Endozoicomonas sp. (ex Bugula neritina AB1)]|nr:hypothetical protein ACH42_11515 [Endozoicomonas sp. (ex Bugula neritina AB1)]